MAIPVNGGFQVNRAALRRAAHGFDAGSHGFEAIMPMSGPPSVNGGSVVINEAIALMLEAIGGLHAQMAAVIGEHGGKLTTAAGNYQAAEDDATDRIRAIGG